MPIPHYLQVAALLSLLVLIAGVRSVEVFNWYTYAGSEEAVVSADATLGLLRRPPGERTLEVALQHCHQHSASSSSASSDPENFCAWIALNSSDNNRPVAVSCFNEWHRQCNRRSQTPSTSKYRQAECDLCSPCAYGKWDACPKCNRVCYCTCAHSRYASNEGTSSVGMFECHQLCDGRGDCNNRNDERTDVCAHYKLPGSPAPDVIPRTVTDNIVIVISLVIFLCVSIGSLYWKYATYHKAMRLSQARPTGQPLVPVNLPAGSYPRQGPVDQPPPPPAYDAVAK